MNPDIDIIYIYFDILKTINCFNFKKYIVTYFMLFAHPSISNRLIFQIIGVKSEAY